MQHAAKRMTKAKKTLRKLVNTGVDPEDAICFINNPMNPHSIPEININIYPLESWDFFVWSGIVIILFLHRIYYSGFYRKWKGYFINRRIRDKMSRFSHLQEKYHIHQKRITFDEYIKFEIRSPENRAIQLLTQSFQTQGIFSFANIMPIMV